MKVKLFTRGGGFVANVTTVPFKLMPEAIQWGERFFVRDHFKDTTEYYGYSEACVWVDVIQQDWEADPAVDAAFARARDLTDSERSGTSSTTEGEWRA